MIPNMVGCGSSASSASAPNKAKFCADYATLGKATTGSPPPAQLVQILKANQASIDDLEKSAPSTLKTDAQTAVNALNAYIKANNGLALAGGANVVAAGNHIDSVCGLRAHAGID